MIRDVPRPDFTDIAVGSLAEPGSVGLLCVPVPFTGKDASPAAALESDAQAADSGEKVDE